MGAGCSYKGAKKGLSRGHLDSKSEKAETRLFEEYGPRLRARYA